MKVWEIEEEGWDACERRLVTKGKISRGYGMKMERERMVGRLEEWKQKEEKRIGNALSLMYNENQGPEESFESTRRRQNRQC